VDLSITLLDLLIVLAYGGAVVALGFWFSRGPQTVENYFLGERSLPCWAVLFSTVATETSTVTFLSIPGMAYAAGGDLRFLQIAFGYMLGRWLAAGWLLPLYFQGEPYTSYEVLERRFGKPARRLASLLFLITRNLSDGLRLFLTALVLQLALGIDLPQCVLLMSAVTVLYTFCGGVRSVIWNDCIQLAIYLLGAVVALGVIVERLPQGAEQFWEFARAEGKLRVLDADFSWASFAKPTMTLWAGLIGGAFLTAATHGTDQLMVQRFLAARSLRSARIALVLSGAMVCLQFALFLLIGVGLAAFYRQFPPDTPLGDRANDRVFAHFVVHQMGPGLVGLTLAAVFAAAMSTLASSLNSSATAFVTDLLVPLAPRRLDEAQRLRAGKLATLFFGALQAGIALSSYAFGTDESTVNQVLKIAGFATGPTLGLYLLGVLTRVGQTAALAGLVLGAALLAWIALATPLAWPWYAAVGTVATFCFGLLVEALRPDRAAPRPPRA
jgi:SSS family transporter